MPEDEEYYEERRKREQRERTRQLMEKQSQSEPKSQPQSQQQSIIYNNQTQYMNERNNLIQEIQLLEQKKLALINRAKAEEQLKEKTDFYKVKITAAARHDIEKLKNLALDFSNPKSIYKVIYENYYKSEIESMIKRVLGDNINKGGIYKITEIDTQKCYIGRATEFKRRWREHAKGGCGIDSNNKLLYNQMLEKGLENFTFEVIEIVDKEFQSEREKYWIGYYRSGEYGFNQNSGG